MQSYHLINHLGKLYKDSKFCDCQLKIQCTDGPITIKGHRSMLSIVSYFDRLLSWSEIQSLTITVPCTINSITYLIESVYQIDPLPEVKDYYDLILGAKYLCFDEHIIAEYLRKCLQTVFNTDISKITEVTGYVLADDTLSLDQKQGWISVVGNQLAGIPTEYHPKVVTTTKRRKSDLQIHVNQELRFYQPGIQITEKDTEYIVQIGNPFTKRNAFYSLPFELNLHVYITVSREDYDTGIWLQCSPQDEKLSYNSETFRNEGEIVIMPHLVNIDFVVYSGTQNPMYLKRYDYDSDDDAENAPAGNNKLQFPTPIKTNLLHPRRDRIGTIFNGTPDDALFYSILIRLTK